MHRAVFLVMRKGLTIWCAVFGPDQVLNKRLRRVIREQGWHLINAPALTTTDDSIAIDVVFFLLGTTPRESDIRATRLAFPASIILVIGESSLQFRAEALAAGATDFIPSNSSSRHLAARVMALMRVRKSFANTRVTAGEIEIDLQHRRCKIGSDELQLSQKEFVLLTLLAENYGQTTPRSELIEGLWQAGAHVQDNTLDVHISRLRRKLSNRTRNQIATTRGVGYRLTAREKYSTNKV